MPQPRSCITCRDRKVRCDKQSPCSNCRRGDVPCTYPSDKRRPRWVNHLDGRLDRATTVTSTTTSLDADPSANRPDLMEKLHAIEKMVKELRYDLEQAGSLSNDTKSDGDSHATRPSVREDNIHKHFGRLVTQEAGTPRYVSSGFWSQVHDELHVSDSDSHGSRSDVSDEVESDDLPAQTQSIQPRLAEHTLPESHTFPFRRSLRSPLDVSGLHPMPSQISFLLEIFSDNVNFYFRIIHLPTVTRMVRDMRSNGMLHFKPSEEALMFSIYYAAVMSMEEDDVFNNFRLSKAELGYQFRVGFESALVNSDFLVAPNITLVQALTIFLFLVRRNDDPRYVWMMTGVVIRMATYLGLQRDGSHLKHLTPFEIEIRRRLWWSICMLDLRASEDQGTDMTIVSGSFDTKIPLNINEADLTPESKQAPSEHSGVTDLSFARIAAGMTDISRQLTIACAQGDKMDIDAQSRLVNQIFQKFEDEYLRHVGQTEDVAGWTAVTIVRLVMAKMVLIIFFPVLHSDSITHISEQMRNKLLVSAIEVAEYNHELNTEEACRNWRWLYQSCIHWHAALYLMFELSRRSWSPTVERAWIALHSVWLMPSDAFVQKQHRLWIPLRRMMNRVRRHRDMEIQRLRRDPQAVAELQIEDQSIPLPLSQGEFRGQGSAVNLVRERWQQLLSSPSSVCQQPDSQLRRSGTTVAPAQSLHGFIDTGGDTNKPMAAPDMSFRNATGTIDSTRNQAAVSHNTALWQDFGKDASIPTVYTQLDAPTNSSSGSDPYNMNSGLHWVGMDDSLDWTSAAPGAESHAAMDIDDFSKWNDWIESAQAMEWGGQGYAV